MGHVDANPAALEALCHGDCRAAPAKRIENDVAFVGTGCDDAFEKGFGFLGLVPEALLRLGVDWVDISPYIAQENARHFVEVTYQERPFLFVFRVPDSTFTIELRHR